MAPATPLRLSPTSPEYKGISQLNIIYEAGKATRFVPLFTPCLTFPLLQVLIQKVVQF